MRWLPLILAVSLLGQPAGVLAAPACVGPMQKSCVKPLFKCFKPKGTCSGEFVMGPTGVVTTQCWANGARREIAATLEGGTIVYRGARGKRCLKGEVVVEGEQSWFRFKKGRKVWTLRRGEQDEMVVTCPDGRVEQYTQDQLNAEATSCGALSDASACPLGTCP